MAQYKINIAPEAAKEIENIYLYIAKDSSNNAARWYFAIYDKVQTIKHPAASSGVLISLFNLLVFNQLSPQGAGN